VSKPMVLFGKREIELGELSQMDNGTLGGVIVDVSGLRTVTTKLQKSVEIVEVVVAQPAGALDSRDGFSIRLSVWAEHVPDLADLAEGVYCKFMGVKILKTDGFGYQATA
jgi:hypothetical protein